MTYNNSTWSDMTDEQYMLINEAYKNQLLEAITEETNIFRISPDNRDCKLYHPMIPPHRAIGEDDTISRVCFADTIEGCFRAIPGCGKYVDNGRYKWPLVTHSTFYVHVPIYDDLFMEAIQDGLVAYPNTKLVPDTYLTQEVWVMDNVRVKCVAEIRAWYDATKNPNFFSVEELPVRLELVEWSLGCQDWIKQCLWEHPEYTLPIYEAEEYENEQQNYYI